MSNQRATAALSAADQQAVAAVPQRIIEAWAGQDAGAFADVFAEDATMILPGVFCHGRDEIRSFMTGAFQGPFKDTRVTGAPIDMRVLGPDVAVVVTKGGVTPAGVSEVSPDRAVRATWVVVKRDNRWQLAAYQNSPANPPEATGGDA